MTTTTTSNETTFGREFNKARREQGFRSQAHLDAFYAYLDHSQTCPACQRFGGVEIDDGVQPVQILCPEGERLYGVSARLDR